MNDNNYAYLNAIHRVSFENLNLKERFKIFNVRMCLNQSLILKIIIVTFFIFRTCLQECE